MRQHMIFGTTAIALAVGLTVGAAPQEQAAPADVDVVATLGARLSLDDYKATLKGLTQFGDRRQGTTRNRDAIDWIEAQLQAVGCTTTFNSARSD